MSSLILREVNDKYHYVQYLRLEVLVSKEDDYMNMTKVVSNFETKNGNPKDLHLWFRTTNSEELVEAVRISIQLPGKSPQPYYSITDGPNDLRGTYCHKLLVPHIASWCSAKFAIEVSEIINRYVEHMGNLTMITLTNQHDKTISEIRSQSEQQKIQYESTISEIKAQSEKSISEIKSQAAENRKLVVDKYNDLVKKFNSRGQEIKSLTMKIDYTNAVHQARYDSILDAFDGQTIKNTKILTMLSNLRKDINNLPIVKLDPTSRSFDIVIKPPSRSTQTFLIISRIYVYERDTRYTHYIINRTQLRTIKRYVNNSESRIIRQYADKKISNTIETLYFDQSGNAIQAWNNLKEKGLVITNGSELFLSDGSNIDNIINELKSINLEPETEMEVIKNEYERLKNITTEEREFLNEFEDAI
jgi:hypothetical protein